MVQCVDSSKEHPVVLYFKSWTNNLSEDKILVFTAIALNHCVQNKQLIIKGYFITKKRLYLVIRLGEFSLNEILEALSKKIALLVYTHLNDQQKLDVDNILYKGNQSTMFTKHVLQDYNLIKIITGEKIELPYHNPRVAYFKKKTHHYKYCSVQDYVGVLGPVVVHT